ncbi:MAG: hypothetical protein V1816_16185 [Pseudomonadota bacterium]
MLVIRPIMDSAALDVFAFKCCGSRAYDWNLEIQLFNTFPHPVDVPSRFELEADDGLHRIETLAPHGVQTVPPAGSISFYCYLDESLWNKARRAVFFDVRGNRFALDLKKGV